MFSRGGAGPRSLSLGSATLQREPNEVNFHGAPASGEDCSTSWMLCRISLETEALSRSAGTRPEGTLHCRDRCPLQKSFSSGWGEPGDSRVASLSALTPPASEAEGRCGCTGMRMGLTGGRRVLLTGSCAVALYIFFISLRNDTDLFLRPFCSC